MLGLSHDALHTIYKGCNSTIPAVRSAGMDRATGEGMQQNDLQQCTAPYEHKNSESLPNYTQ